MSRRVTAAIVGAAMAALTATAAAQAAPPAPQPYQFNSFPGFRDVLPPGTNGLDNAAQLLAFEADHTSRPAHSSDQRDMYANLVSAAPNIQQADIPNFFKDSSFGFQPADAGRTYHPGNRDDVTVVRDNSYGVPHIYATTRAGAMFATGYITAEDRLFFIDILRHAGRAQLAQFAGGSPGNVAMDESQWKIAPYTEADLQKQIDLGQAIYGAEGAQLQDDLRNYVDGINRYITELQTNPVDKINNLPGEYAAINQPGGPEPWKGTDVIATASLVGGIFGRGGGGELTWGRLLQSFQSRLGRAKGLAAWSQLRAVDDRRAPTTVHNGRRFAYRTIPRHVARGSVALPDPGSFQDANVVESSTGSAASASARAQTRSAAAHPSGLAGMLAFPHSASNWELVSARRSATGRALAVMGPQVGYFAPQILMEQDVHAPTVDARGAAFPGVNLYVELGHGRDYAWSATSAGQDIEDTFALDLCNPSGGAVSRDARFYMFRGQCLPMEEVRRTESWTPNLADQTPAGSVTLLTLRTKMGLVVGRGTVRGKPVAYTKLRSTYFHEVDSARGFSDFNNPDKMRNPHDFQVAASKIGYTFNWSYVDDKHIAYFNSGNNPVRAANTDPRFPVAARFEWRGFNPDLNIASYTPFSQHPQVIDQDYLTSWNNKQAPGYNAPDTDATYTSIYRSQLLDDRLRARMRGGHKLVLADVINAMGDAGTVDLRGDKVLPQALRVIGRQNDPQIAGALATLTSWYREGSHRRDANKDGTYEHSDAIKIMDAWWPLLVKADLQPALGDSVYNQLTNADPIDNPPNNNGDHLGSAYDVGMYGSIQEDLLGVIAHDRALRRAAAKRRAAARKRHSTRHLAVDTRTRCTHRHPCRRRRPRAPAQPLFCGGGSLRACQAALVGSLRQALAIPRTTVYHDPSGDCADGDQMCFDSIRFRPLGAVTQPLIPWINRPTYQQAIEIQGHGPR